MTRMPTRYKRSVIKSDTILILVGVAVLIWLIVRQRNSIVKQTYQNKEEWEITWNDEGLPVKVVVHRKAEQGG